MTTTIHVGDCRDVLATLPAESVDVIVTDPPYGLGFMGKDWDHEVPGVAFWEAMYRVMKPGAYLLAFGGTRTFHRIAVAIEDAGFEIRDTLMWLYGSGFPKSHDVSKAIDKAAGAEREVIGTTIGAIPSGQNKFLTDTPKPICDVTAPATPEAAQWAGWGTALKPAYEPIILARKPLAGTVAANVLTHGTGALNIDASRIGTDDAMPARKAGYSDSPVYGTGAEGFEYKPNTAGRWPANVILDEAAADGHKWSRFFYVAKASREERNRGLDELPERVYGLHDDDGNRIPGERKNNHTAPMPAANHHPTVKPVALMQWLVRLITPPGGVVLDPFMGSGSTGVACSREGVDFIGIELNLEYVEIARRRIEGDAPMFAPVEVLA